MEDVISTLAPDDAVTAPATALPPPTAISAAEASECSCPEWCERDHDRD